MRPTGGAPGVLQTYVGANLSPNGLLFLRFGRTQVSPNLVEAERNDARSETQNAYRTTRWRFAETNVLGEVASYRIARLEVISICVGSKRNTLENPA